MILLINQITSSVFRCSIINVPIDLLVESI